MVLEGLLFDQADKQAESIKAGSDKLLRQLWRQHPERMRQEYEKGRAHQPETVIIHKPKAPEGRRPALHSIAVAEQVIEAVGAVFELSYGEITGSIQTDEYVDARAVASWLLKKRGWSLSQIGRAMGGRDHATISNLLNRMPVYLNRSTLVMRAMYELRHLGER